MPVRTVSELLELYATRRWIAIDELYRIALRDDLVRDVHDFNKLMSRYLSLRTETRGGYLIYLELPFEPTLTDVRVRGDRIGSVRVTDVKEKGIG